MRNLKKFLALVLAMMMVFSLMVTVNAATAFPDDADISATYEQAVEIMTELGVFVGDDEDADGINEFRPQAPIRRSEFAKLVYAIDTGDTSVSAEGAEAFKGLANFSDVADDHWAAGIIAYVQINGYMVGDSGSGGNFRPNDYVSGFEVITTLSRVLGETIDTNNWQINAALAARKLGITNGMGTDVSYYDNATREQSCQMVFNTLIYTATGEQTKYTIKSGTGDVLYSGYSAQEALANYDLAAKDPDKYGTPTVETATSYTGSLAAANFNGLIKVEGEDAFKRPTIKWTDQNSKKIAEFAKSADSEYNGDFTGKDAKAFLNQYKDSNGNSNYTLYYNGVQVTDESTQVPHLVLPDGSVDPLLYVDDSNGIRGYEIFIYGSKVVVREAYLAYVDKAKSNGDITVTVYEVGNEDDAVFTVKKADETYDEVANHQGKFVAIYVRPEFSSEEAQEDLGLDVDDIILAVETLDEVDGVEVARRDINNAKYDSSIVVRDYETKVTGGTYKFNNEAIYKCGESDPAKATFVYNGVLKAIQLEKSILYLHNGYVLLIDQPDADYEAEPDPVGYAYFYDVIRIAGQDTAGGDVWDSEGGHTNDETGTDSFKARLLLADLDLSEDERDLTDGVYVELAQSAITISEETDKDGNLIPSYEDYEQYLGSLVYYAIDEHGVYQITPIAATQIGTPVTAIDVDYEETIIETVSEGKLDIANGKSEGTVPGGEDANEGNISVAFDSKTVFMLITTHYDSKTPNFKDSSKVLNIYDMPDYNPDNAIVTAVYDCVDDDGQTYGDAQPVDSKNGPEKITRVVLIVDSGDSDEPEEVDDFYFIVRDPDATDTYVFTSQLDDSVTPGSKEDVKLHFYIYQAVVNGEIKKVMVQVEAAASEYLNIARDEEGVTYDGPGYVILQNIKPDTFNEDYYVTLKCLADATDVYGGYLITDKTQISFAGISEVKNEHITLEEITVFDGDGYNEDGPDQEDYLIRAAGDKAFTYSTKDGSINEVALEDIDKKAARDTYTNGGVAVRNTKHTTIKGLFLDVTPEE